MVEEEEKKKGEAKKPKTDEEKKTMETKEAAPVPVVLKIYMHCEGCATKIKKGLKGFDGVEEVETDCKAHTVTVKGKNVDPVKVMERVQKKSHKKVELLSPIPKPEEAKKAEPAKKEPKPEEKKPEQPKVITVVVKVHMHCEACAQDIRKSIMRMKGVEAADPDLKSSQVTVKGIFDPPKLVEFIYKKTGRHAAIVKTEAEKKKEEKKDEKKEEKQEKKEGEEEAKKVEEEPKPDFIKNEFYYNPPKPPMEYYHYSPQIFSDENPNACSVM